MKRPLDWLFIGTWALLLAAVVLFWVVVALLVERFA